MSGVRFSPTFLTKRQRKKSLECSVMKWEVTLMRCLTITEYKQLKNKGVRRVADVTIINHSFEGLMRSQND